MKENFLYSSKYLLASDFLINTLVDLSKLTTYQQNVNHPMFTYKLSIYFRKAYLMNRDFDDGNSNHQHQTVISIETMIFYSSLLNQ